MQNKLAYDQWSARYDDISNKTRDLEARAIRTILSSVSFSTVIELGAGTGKNTAWLASRARRVMAVDFSEKMQAFAKNKQGDPTIEYVLADITRPWNFVNEKADLITESLFLEHIADINTVFQQANTYLLPGGYFYCGELHPFKQYQGSKARFSTEEATVVLECYTHNVSDYLTSALTHGFECRSLTEWFDDEGDETKVPRILALLFQKVKESF